MWPDASIGYAATTCSDPAAFHVEMDFSGAWAVGIHAAHERLRGLRFHAYPRGGSVWWRTGAFKDQFAGRLRQDGGVTAWLVVIAFLDDAMLIQVLLRDARLDGMDGWLAGARLHRLFDLGPLFWRHGGQDVRRHQHPA